MNALKNILKNWPYFLCLPSSIFRHVFNLPDVWIYWIVSCSSVYTAFTSMSFLPTKYPSWHRIVFSILSPVDLDTSMLYQLLFRCSSFGLFLIWNQCQMPVLSIYPIKFGLIDSAFISIKGNIQKDSSFTHHHSFNFIFFNEFFVSQLEIKTWLMCLSLHL